MFRRLQSSLVVGVFVAAMLSSALPVCAGPFQFLELNVEMQEGDVDFTVLPGQVATTQGWWLAFSGNARFDTPIGLLDVVAGDIALTTGPFVSYGPIFGCCGETRAI